MPRADFVAVGANVRNNPPMRRRQVRRDYRKIRRSDVALLNEIGRAWYKALLRAMFVVGRWKIVGLAGTETPILLRRSQFKVLRKQVIVLHEGKAKASPRRRLLIVVVEHRPSGEILAFVCTHWVSGAWNKKRKFAKAWRRAMWLLGYDVTDDALDRLHREGITTIFYGDLNKRFVQKFGPGWNWIAGERNIVKMAIWEAKSAHLRVDFVRMDRDVETDHPMIRAGFRLVA